MKQLTERQQKELDKYISAFTYGTTSTKNIYGHGNWGHNCYDYIEKIKPNSILDIGCGKGVFINDMSEKFKIVKTYGLDIASVRTKQHIQNNNIIWIDSMAHDIPLDDDSVEYITSFDVLEHVLEEDVDTIVNEFYRVCTKGLILKIAYRQANERALSGDVLHMTVRAEDWWIEKFKQKFEYIGNHNEYLLFSKQIKI